MSRLSPAASARKRLAERYDTDAKNAQDMADNATDSGFTSVAGSLGNLAERRRTYAQRARRSVGPRGEKLASTVTEAAPASPSPLAASEPERHQEANRARRNELFKRSLNEDRALRRKSG